jgi:hypothetical protein
MTRKLSWSPRPDKRSVNLGDVICPRGRVRMVVIARDRAPVTHRIDLRRG